MEARLLQAQTEVSAIKGEVTATLKGQLHARERLRPYRQLTQAYSLASLDPLAGQVYTRETVNSGAKTMLAGYTKQRYPENANKWGTIAAFSALGVPTGRRPRQFVDFRDNPIIKNIDNAYKVVAPKPIPSYRRPSGVSRGSTAAPPLR